MIRLVAPCVLSVLILPLIASVNAATPDVTVIVNFEGKHSAIATRAMEREVAHVLAPSGIALEWTSILNAAGTYKDLVVVTFNGSCEFQQVSRNRREEGPLAITRTSEGQVLPFAEVNCERIVSLVRRALWPGDRSFGDEFLGRALGRVLAHELVHMLTRSGQHSRDGIEQPALSGDQLIGDSLGLGPVDIERLARSISSRRPISRAAATPVAMVHSSRAQE